MRKLILLLSGMLLFLVSCQPKPKAKKTASLSAFDKAYNLLTVNQDSAFYYFNKLVSESRDSQQVALAYTNMAMIQSDAGDYYGAQESLISSVQFLGEMNKDRQPYQAQNYNELAITAIKLKNYKEAITYGDQALALTSDSSFKTTILNNQANAYRYLKDYRPAMERYRQAINLADRRGKPFARVLTNFAISRWLDNPKYNPVPELLRALQIRLQERDAWGQNSSYAHLADYYTEHLPDSALYYANRRFNIVKQLKSPDDELEALQKLIALAPMAKVRPYFTRFTALNDSLQTARNAAKNQFALIRYNVEKNKADNLRLQNENQTKKYQLFLRNVLLSVGTLIFIAALVFFLAWLKRRNIREAREKQEAIHDTQRKASKKVHDALSNDIYVLMKRIKHDLELDRQWLFLQTSNIYEQSRDLSYEILYSINENFDKVLKDLLMRFGSEDTHVVLAGNDKELWEKVNATVKLELKYVLQELMVNMQKHSQAANVIIKFDQNGTNGIVTYIDDGIGLPNKVIHGNGLTNTETRINSIGGGITFDNNDAKGLKINITFPLA